MPQTDAELRDQVAIAVVAALFTHHDAPLSEVHARQAVRAALTVADEMVRQRAERPVA